MLDAVARSIKLYADDAKIYDRVNNIVQSTRPQRCVIYAEDGANVLNRFINMASVSIFIMES